MDKMQNIKLYFFESPIKIMLYITILIIIYIKMVSATEDKVFQIWKSDLKKEAITLGVKNDTFDKVFSTVKIIDKVIELDRRQPERKITFQEYLNKALSFKRIKLGREKYINYKKELDAVSKKYNVQGRFIVAIWGVETNYGSYTGKFPLISSLTTLAFDGRRSKLFRKQLLDALIIIEKENINLHEMLGSWAGAMGQSQFMPSSYIRYAQDYDNDGIKDIWNSHLDIFASIANYLKSYDWDNSKTWGREVIIKEKDFDKLNLDDLKNKSLNHWKTKGVKKSNGEELPHVDILATLIMPDGFKGKKFLVYNNFKIIKKYNNSNYYALSVGLLSDGVVH